MNVLKRDFQGEVMFDATGDMGGVGLSEVRALVRMLVAQNRAACDAFEALISRSPALSSDDFAALVAPEFVEIEDRLKAIDLYAIRAQNTRAAERGRAYEPSAGADLTPLFDDEIDVEGTGD